MISAVVLVKNQAEQLKECLTSLQWCDEIIVINDNSTDTSAQVAEKMGAKVYTRELKGDFSAQRNFGLGKAKYDWVFFVDADEVVSDELREELYQQTSQFLTSQNGYYLHRVDSMWGKKLKHGDMARARFLRIGKKDKGEWKGKVHERWNIIGETGVLHSPLLHFPHQTVGEFLTEINFYSTLRAEELQSTGVKTQVFSIVGYPIGKFLLNYIIKLGFLDGTAGIISATMMSFYSFLVRGKLWQIQKRKKIYDFGN